MGLLSRFFSDRGWHQMRIRNFKQCAEQADQITIISEQDKGFYSEVEVLIQPPYSINDEFLQMLQTDRVELRDLTVERSSTTLVVRIL